MSGYRATYFDTSKSLALSSSVKNQAFVGESGNRKLPIRELAKNDAMLGVLTKT